jgi:Pyruvate/2-oxoacid:ferredoxin oxidoreductase gamma subunit
MFQVRIHGRGGQGVVAPAELLSVGFADEERRTVDHRVGAQEG